MPRVRHENSIDNVPLHMSACRDPGSPGEERTRETEQGEGGEREKEGERGERERGGREGEVRRRCNNGAMGRLSWGSLCLVCGLALCASAPLIAIVDLLAGRFRKLPSKAVPTLPRGRRRKDASSGRVYVAMHRCSTSCCHCDPNFLGCNKA